MHLMKINLQQRLHTTDSFTHLKFPYLMYFPLKDHAHSEHWTHTQIILKTVTIVECNHLSLLSVYTKEP